MSIVFNISSITKVFFKDKMNLAALVRKNDELVYTRYNQKRQIDSNTMLHGASMSKTALSTACT